MGARLTDEQAAAVMRAAKLEPLEPHPGSRKPWLCRCQTCGDKVSPAYANVSNGHSTGCGFCSGTRVDGTEAVNVMRRAGFEPKVPYPGKNDKKWKCRCIKCDREVFATYATASKNHGCPYCVGLKLVEDDAIEDMRLRGFEPLVPYPGADTPWLCRCSECGRQPSLTRSNVMRGKGCGYCGKRLVDPDEADAYMRSVGLEPLVSYPGDAPWRCRCMKCENVVEPWYRGVKGSGSGCRYCAPYGIDLKAPALVYVLTSADFYSVKVGITSTASADRVARHASKGWTVVQTWAVPTGDDAYNIEQAIIAWWRDILGAPRPLTKADMPQTGWTETASLFHVDLDETIERIDAEVARLTQ
ncbi:MAG: hypothetical protein ACI9N0_000959 [Ilumatobacter sp.]|jgi:hypothetical protein